MRIALGLRAASALTLLLLATPGQALQDPAPAPGVPCRPLPVPVRDGLLWLARHQDEDGHWDMAAFPRRCRPGKPCGDAADPGVLDFQTGVGALSLLAFLGSGIGMNAQDELQGVNLGSVVRAGVRNLVKHQGKDGALNDVRLMKPTYAQALAVNALAEALRSLAVGAGSSEEESAAIRRALERAVESLVAWQNPGSGWRYGLRTGDNDSSVTATALLALLAARRAGVRVPESCVAGGLAWLEKASEPKDGRVGYNARGTGKVFVPGKNEQFIDHPTLTAAAALCQRAFVPDGEIPPRTLRLMSKDLPDAQPTAADYYYWYYGTRVAMTVFDGAERLAWKTAVVKILSESQSVEADSCTRGSWAPRDRWGLEGGMIYATAINTLTLEYALLAKPFDFSVPPAPAGPAAWLFKLRGGGRVQAISYEEVADGYRLKVATGSVKLLKENVEQIQKLEVPGK